jgi:UDP-N-acetylglucosamine 2-epimerase (non-hydrolysing)
MILISFGTRPEWIKIKPLLDKLKGKIPFKLVCTGQHSSLIDASTKDYSIEYLYIEEYKNRLDSIFISILQCADVIFKDVSHVMVQGDTTSALAMALAAFHRKIPIIHLEAGLRSFDKAHPYPEEFNRISIGAMADIHLCPTKTSLYNLNNVKSINSSAHVVGNTVLDNLKHLQSTLEPIVLITLHRRENLYNVKDWFNAIEELAIENPHLEFIFPMHPNPEIQKHKNIFKTVKTILPLSHEDCIDYISRCSLIITDSGGIQEESAFLKKKCIVCRKTTERIEGMGRFSQLCKEPMSLKSVFTNTKIELISDVCPYGDGYASDKIACILENIM